MSQFNGIPFKVMVENERYFPMPELDDDGKYTFDCRAFVATQLARQQLHRMVSIVTWKRPLGTISVIGHVEAGLGKATLAIPDGAGFLRYHSAVLVKMSNIEAYALHSNRGYLADLSFVILSNPV